LKPITVLVACATALTLVACGQARGSDESSVVGVTEDTVRLGMTAPLTGPGASYSGFAKGMQAYFAKVNADGGIHGRKIDLVVRDDAYDPAKTVTETSRLVKSDEVLAVVGGVGGATQSAVAATNNRDEIPTLLAITGLDALVDPPMPFVSIMQPTYGMESALWIDYIERTHPGAKVGLLYQNDNSGKTVDAALTLAFAGRYASEGYGTTDADVSTQITALRQAGVDVLLFASAPKFATQGLLAIERLGWNVPTLVSSVGYDSSVATNAGGAADGVVSALSVRPYQDESDPVVKAANDIVRQYGERVEPNQWTMVGIANATILAAVLEDAGEDLNRETLMKAHDSLTLDDGPWFGSVELSPTDRVALGCFELVTIQNGSHNALGEPVCS
jgi:ABC-type branched-subunit amino acid transport system substrate-binding protein